MSGLLTPYELASHYPAIIDDWTSGWHWNELRCAKYPPSKVSPRNLTRRPGNSSLPFASRTGDKGRDVRLANPMWYLADAFATTDGLLNLTAGR
jgi:hypothetical protein